MFEGLRLKQESIDKVKDKRLVVGLNLPDTVDVKSVYTKEGINLRNVNGVYVADITSLDPEKIRKSITLVPSYNFFNFESLPLLFGTVTNSMGKTILSVPYWLEKLPYTVGNSQTFNFPAKKYVHEKFIFVLGTYVLPNSENGDEKKYIAILNYETGTVVFEEEQKLAEYVMRGKAYLINAKVVNGRGSTYIAGVKKNLPVFELISAENKSNRSKRDNTATSSDDKQDITKLNHDKYRHRVLSKYIRQYLHGNLTPYKFLNKSRMAKTTDKEIKILFDEVFKPLYPKQFELFQRDYKHVNMGLVLEYFIVTFLADKKGYKSKYPIETPVNTADSNFYLKQITSQKWGFVSKLRNKELLHQYLGHVNDMRRFAMVFADTDYGKETQRFLELKNSLYAVKANTKYRFREEDIFGVESKPLVKMLLALIPKNYKLEVENYTYKVEDVGFSEVHEGFREMGYTLDESDVREKVETPHKVYFATKNSKVVRYIYDGARENGKLAGVTFNGEPLYAPDIKSFGAYYIVKSLSEYYAKHKEITDLDKLKLLHLLALRERDLFEQVAKQIGFEVSSGTLDALEIALANIVAKCDVSVRQSLLSGGFFVPYVTYTVNEGFDMPRYRYHQKYGNVVEEYSLENMAQVIKNHLGDKINTDGTLLTHDLY